MKRMIYSQLIDWKNNPNRKPLILKGARQVGKTWLMKELGRNEFDECIYINFEASTLYHKVFEMDLDPYRILQIIKTIHAKEIDVKKTLFIFDEIQACPRALTSLKYFNENAPEINIIAASSILGVSLHQGQSFPVGQIDFLDVYPLNFLEFLIALKHDEFVDLIQKRDFDMLHLFKEKLIELLKQYYLVGGMPAVVKIFSENKSYKTVREEQQKILMTYENDFSKHAPNKEVPKIRMVWNSILLQLSKENKKFIYKHLKEGARAKEFETAILWLIDAGIIHKVNRIEVPKIPLNAYADFQDFKLYFVDIGLMVAKAAIEPNIILNDNDLFVEFKGTLTEQYVLQQLKSNRKSVYYWAQQDTIAEVDFLIEHQSSIVSIEAKATINVKSKSLKTYFQKFEPKYVFRTSLQDFKDQGWVINIPLYALDQILVLNH